MTASRLLRSARQFCLLFPFIVAPAILAAQGVTTSAMTGIVTDDKGAALPDAIVLAVHVPSGTQYRGTVRTGGIYTIPNMRIGGPYKVTVTFIGYQPKTEDNIFLSLGQTYRHDAQLVRQAVQLQELAVVAEKDEVLNAGRSGAGTFIDPTKVALIPTIKRSIRDLIKLDPRNDGNYSFAGRNWLYNNVSLDGSYFNNSFGLDDPAPGGQTNAEPVPYDAVEQVQVSVAPFSVLQGGFTGANVNTVTKSGTNDFKASIYSFYRNDGLQGSKVDGSPVLGNTDLRYNQSGASFSGPIIRDKLFFFVIGELERNHEPGSNFVASRNGSSGFGISRVTATIMDSIRNRMIQQYNYDPGAYEGYTFHTDNNKLLAKLDWNINARNNLSFRYNLLDAKRDLGPHPFVLSFNNTGRGPNESSLPFYKSGYAINNKLNSFALELNSRGTRLANHLFASYNRFRDFRAPFSEDFPTIEIGEAGVTYTTVGHEPFSINNILDQDVWQLTNNFSLYRGRHSFTLGANYERFSFFNSFNIFRDGVFFLPAFLSFGSTFSSLNDFFNATKPGPGQKDFRGMITPSSVPYKGENISVGQLSFYAQDEFLTSSRFNLTYGLRVDIPTYYTKPVDNPFSRSLTALDENRQPEVVDQSRLPGAKPLFSPRLGFNWNAVGDRRTQIRGGTGIFTGRVPFVWVGNAISNPGANPNLYPTGPQVKTHPNTTLAQSFDVNAMDPNFKWPQVWTSDLAVDQQLPSGFLGTLEVIYGKDFHSVFMRNADLRAPIGALPDGRPFFGDCGFGASKCPAGSSEGGNELNPDGAGIYVIDNKNQGHSFNITAQLRKNFGAAVSTTLGYSFTEAKNNLKSTEIASVLWQNQPVQGDPNNPELSYSEFGQRHHIVGAATFAKVWSPTLRTQVGVFIEAGQGNRFTGAGGNRYSFIYSGDVNGDGTGGNDLIYIPRDASDITLAVIPATLTSPAVTVAQQSAALEAFIEQDKYLSKHRGQIAQRFGEPNPWYENIDLQILQDLGFRSGSTRHTFQITFSVLNATNLINSGWGVRKVANASALSPLTLVGFAGNTPVFNFTGPTHTFDNSTDPFSRWRLQFGLRYFIQ